MTKGPNRLVLDQYIDTAAEGALKGAGSNWKSKAKDLKTLSEALAKAAVQAELRIGEQTLTGPALRAGMEESASSLALKSEQLHAAGEALAQVGRQLSDTREARDALADLGEKPPVYQAPPGTGVPPTDEELAAQAAASGARQGERNAWQSEYDKQEARSLALTREMDAGFLAAIPPMKEIHGEEDPTEPPPNVPSGPSGPYLPGTQAPPATGGGGGGNPGGGNTGGGLIGGGNGGDGNGDGGGKDKPTPVITIPPTIITETPTTPTPTPTTTTNVHTEGPTSTVTGTSQSGITYQPSGAQVSAPIGATSGTSGVTAATLGAAGAAGGAGGLTAGSVRPGATPTSASRSTPVRAIGSTGRAGSAGALSRSAASTGSSAARSAGAGSAASRSAGSAAGRGAAAGSAAGRGGAGSRGAAAGSTSGSRSGGRGSNGARSAGAGSTGGRSGRKGERDTTIDRDSLVYDQDWLGDDDVAPGVLD